jgi:WD40 repeat protein
MGKHLGYLWLIAGYTILMTATASRGAGPVVKEKTGEDAQRLGVDVHGDLLPPAARARFGTTRFRHGSPVYQLVVSPNGKMMATLGSTNDRRLRLWDAHTGTELRSFAVSQVTGVAFSPDSQFVTVAKDGSILQMWNTATGQEVQKLARNAAIGSFSFSPDGKDVVTTGNGDTVQIWDVDNDRLKQQLKWQAPKAAQKGTLETFARGLLDQLAGTEPEDMIPSAADYALFSPDGRYVAARGISGAADWQHHVVFLWEVRTGKAVRTWTKRIDLVGQPAGPLVFSPNGKVLACNNGKEITLWSVETGKTLHTINSGENGSLAFSPDNLTLAVADHAGAMKLYDLATGREIRTFEHSEGLLTVAFVPGKNLVAAAGSNNHVQFWDPATGKELNRFEGHAGAIQAVAVAPDGKTVVTLVGDRRVHVWDPVSGREIRRLEIAKDDPQATLLRFDLSRDGRWLALCTSRVDPMNPQPQDTTIHVWDLARNKRHLKIALGERAPTDLGFDQPGQRLAAGFDDGSVILWQTETGRQVRQLMHKPVIKTDDNETGPGLRALQFSADNRTLLTLTHAVGNPVDDIDADAVTVSSAAVWELATGKQRRHFQIHHPDPVEAEEVPDVVDRGLKIVSEPGPFLRLVPRGDFILLGSSGTYALLNRRNGEEVRRFGAPRINSRSAAFSPDGKHLAGGSTDGNIYVWETATGTLLSRTPGHRSVVRQLAFSADGKMLVSVSADTTGLAWDFAALRARRTDLPSSLSSARLQTLWNELASPDAARADRSMDLLQAAPSDSVTFLDKQLKPTIVRVTAKEIDQLIADLDNNDFAARETATKSLEKLEQVAKPALRKALAGPQPSLELRRRMERLLERLDGATLEPERLRSLRAIEVLEQIATPDARRVLEALAKGTPGVGLTQEARAALARIK